VLPFPQHLEPLQPLHPVINLWHIHDIQAACTIENSTSACCEATGCQDAAWRHLPASPMSMTQDRLGGNVAECPLPESKSASGPVREVKSSRGRLTTAKKEVSLGSSSCQPCAAASHCFDCHPRNEMRICTLLTLSVRLNGEAGAEHWIGMAPPAAPVPSCILQDHTQTYCQM
jgi:hypothetical protein